jgi:hypothetical protein
MVISHRYRFIFVKTGKTAGTSIEVFLSSVCGPEDVLTPFSKPEQGHRPRNYRGFFNPIPELMEQASFAGGIGGARLRSTLNDLLTRRRFYHHIPAWQTQLRCPRRVWAEYFKFCVERNPWDKAVSGWYWYNHKYGGQTSLDQYLELLRERITSHDPGVGAYPFNYPNYAHPRSGRLMMDRVLRYENLEQELASVLTQLGIPAEGALRARAKSGFRKDGGRYQTALSSGQRRVIGELFKEEIQLHGYRFDD